MTDDGDDGSNDDGDDGSNYDGDDEVTSLFSFPR